MTHIRSKGWFNLQFCFDVIISIIQQEALIAMMIVHSISVVP